MKGGFAILVLSFALLGCNPMLGRDSAPSAAAGASAAAATDADFMRGIWHASLAEVATGKLAVQKARSAQVKRFGQHMVDEHSALESDGAALAQAKGVQPPTRPDLRHQAAMKNLELASGDAFDREYLQQMVKDHADTLQLLQAAATKANDAQVRQLAQKAIPHVQQHLAMAQRLAGEVVGKAQ